MNKSLLIKELQKLYPKADITPNDVKNPTTVTASIEPAAEHPEYSVHIVVVDSEEPHYHQKSAQIYEVMRGTLTLYKNNKKTILQQGEIAIIPPGEVHNTQGEETWVRIYSEPGLMSDDYILAREHKQPTEHAAIVVHNVPDIAKAEEFYTKIGFTTLWKQHKNNHDYLLMRYENNIVLLRLDKTPTVSTMMIMVNDIQKCYQYMKKETPHNTEPLTEDDFGNASFTVKDPFGAQLFITQAFVIANNA